MSSRPHAGFTLIELMITVAIIAILAVIALPSYQAYIIRGHRAAAQSEMLDLASRQQQFFLGNRAYATTLAELGYALPAGIGARYAFTDANLAVDNTGAPPRFTVTFVAKGAQSSDGNLTIDQAGVKSPAEKW